MDFFEEVQPIEERISMETEKLVSPKETLSTCTGIAMLMLTVILWKSLVF